MSGAPHGQLGRRRVAAAQPARLRPLPATGAADATKLQARSVHKLREELRIEADNESVARHCADYRPRKSGASKRCSHWPSGSCRSIRCTSRSCAMHAPDVMLISPLVHFGSAQADFVAVRVPRRPGRDAAV